jgi:hypothetical protein
MKTKSSLRNLAKIRVMAIVLTIAAIAVIEFSLTERLAAKVGRITAHQADTAAIPNVSLSDLIAASR